MGRIIEWYVTVGKLIGVGDPLFKIDVNRMLVFVDSAEEGIIASISAGNGVNVVSNQPVADIIDSDFKTDVVSLEIIRRGDLLMGGFVTEVENIVKPRFDFIDR